jgi:hypothetical protein
VNWDARLIFKHPNQKLNMPKPTPNTYTDLDNEIISVLSDPSTSYWLKRAIWVLIERDPVDAANDAEVLAKLIEKRCASILLADDLG